MAPCRKHRGQGRQWTEHLQELATGDIIYSGMGDWHHHWNANRKNGYPNIPQEKLMLGYAGEPSEHEYLTDDLTEKAVQYLKRQSANPDKPFFL